MPNPVSTGLPNPASYTTNGDGTVTDNVTGLIWEGAVNPNSLTQAAAATYCASKGGDWRVPTRLELFSIVDVTASVLSTMPAINATYFPNTPAADFWTSTVYELAPNLAWNIKFFLAGTTGTDWLSVTSTSQVRCVRAPAPKCYAAHYIVQSGGLVLDAATGLTWQQNDDGAQHTWGDATTHCAGLGTGWRIPSVNELETIVDDTRATPPEIDATTFPNTGSTSSNSDYWTSSPYANSVGYNYAWAVGFIQGNSHVYNTVDYITLRVRCVR
jgi:hypothetical protein